MGFYNMKFQEKLIEMNLRLKVSQVTQNEKCIAWSMCPYWRLIDYWIIESTDINCHFIISPVSLTMESSDAGKFVGILFILARNKWIIWRKKSAKLFLNIYKS